MQLTLELDIELRFVIEPYVRQYCDPIFFTKSLESAKGNITANGSFGFVDTGTKKVLVTCRHVWDEFQKAKLHDADLKMGICLGITNPVLFDPSEPIDQNQELDLATFDISGTDLSNVGRKFYPLSHNPPRSVSKDDRIFFIGFPGKGREVRDSDGALGFVRAPFAVLVIDVSPMKFFVDISGLSLPPKEFGGISGCPCFLVRRQRPPLLVGFATSCWSDVLSVTHAKCINRDGSLAPP
jgi:hypothetical protein